MVERLTVERVLWAIVSSDACRVTRSGKANVAKLLGSKVEVRDRIEADVGEGVNVTSEQSREEPSD
jgi:hypothetical protein